MSPRDPVASRLVRRATLVVIVGLGLAACARNARLDARVEQLATALVETEARGAMRCAPRELATAQSQLEFARLEREQGDTARAFAHLDVAADNAKAAKLLSEPGRCGGGSGAPDASGLPASAAPTP